MKCMICKTEVTDKRRKKCPTCGAKLSLSKFENYLFGWSDADVNQTNDLKSKAVDFSTKKIKQEKDTEGKSENKNVQTQNKSSGQKQVNSAKETYKRQESERRASERAERAKSRKNGFWFIGIGAFLFFTIGINADGMPMPSLAVLGISALIFWFMGFYKVFNQKGK